MARGILIGLGLLSLLLATACNSRFDESNFYKDRLDPSLNTEVYNDEAVGEPAPITQDSKVLVACRAEDQIVQEMFEDTFVERLQQRGYTAVPSYRVYPAYGDVHFSERMFRERAQRLGITHVIASPLTERFEESLPGGEVALNVYTSELQRLTAAQRAKELGRTRPSGAEVQMLQAQVVEAQTGRLLWTSDSEYYQFGMTRVRMNDLITKYLDSMDEAQLLR